MDKDIEEALREEAGPPEDNVESPEVEGEGTPLPDPTPEVRGEEQFHETENTPQKHVENFDYVKIKVASPDSGFTKLPYVVMGFTSTAPSSSIPGGGGVGCTCVEIYDMSGYLATLLETTPGTWQGGGYTVTAHPTVASTWVYLGANSAGRTDCPAGASWENAYTLECSSSSSYSSESSGSKFAITPFRDEYITWSCSEDPNSFFYDTVELILNKDGTGTYVLPPEFIECVDTSTLRTISAIADRPSFCAAAIMSVEDRLVVHGKAKKASILTRRPYKLTVRIEALRKEFSKKKWPERTARQFERNNWFWSTPSRETFL